MVLTQGAAAPAHGDQEDQEAGQDEEDGDGDEAVVQEVQILSVGQLGHNTGQDQDEAEDLKMFPYHGPHVGVGWVGCYSPIARSNVKYRIISIS